MSEDGARQDEVTLRELTGFADVERRFVREKALPDFDWVYFDTPSEAVPLNKPLSEARVALVSTSGAYLSAVQEPFEMRSPLGDDSFRIIPRDTAPGEVALSHPGYDTRRAAHDLNCVFPFELLRGLEEQGVIGEAAPRHISFMGFVSQPERLIAETAPQAASVLREDGVDLALLVPA